MNKVVLKLYLGIKSLLSKFGTYDLEFRAKMLFSFIVMLDLMWFVTIGTHQLGFTNLFDVNDYVFYGIIALIIFGIYFYISVLEKKIVDIKSTDVRKFKTIAIIWIGLTFLVLIPIGAFSLV